MTCKHAAPLVLLADNKNVSALSSVQLISQGLDIDLARRLRKGRGGAASRGVLGAADEGGGDAGAVPPQVVRPRGGEGPVRAKRRRASVQGVLLLRRRLRPGSAAGAQALQLRSLDQLPTCIIV
jgi:hypothetical protein